MAFNQQPEDGRQIWTASAHPPSPLLGEDFRSMMRAVETSAQQKSNGPFYRLAVAVIYRAVQDLASTNTRIREDAREWLIEQNEDRDFWFSFVSIPVPDRKVIENLCRQ